MVGEPRHGCCHGLLGAMAAGWARFGSAWAKLMGRWTSPIRRGPHSLLCLGPYAERSERERWSAGALTPLFWVGSRKCLACWAKREKWEPAQARLSCLLPLGREA
ncbi:hypothetical protein ACFX2B_013347 [Malus domestica]